MTVILWRSICSYEDAEIVRVLRNRGRQWFADDHHILPEEQERWWKRVQALPSRDFVCLIPAQPTPPAFGMLTRRDGQLWVSLAVHPDWRGQGLGTEIYRLLRTTVVPRLEPVFAAIHKDNHASLGACAKAGYVLDSDVSAPGIEPARAAEWPVYRGDPT